MSDLQSNENVHIPATPTEIAQSIRVSESPVGLVIRKLAFERDMLAERERSSKSRLIGCIDLMIDNWDEWEAEAGHASQVDQDSRSGTFIMRERIAQFLWKVMGWK